MNYIKEDKTMKISTLNSPIIHERKPEYDE